MTGASVYVREAVKVAPRLLSLIDRNPISKTYGCFDRQYWHYTATDFPCARSQEAALTLALLYKIEHKENPYYRSPLILQLANAGVSFWRSMQDPNGSFSEWYPRENSFVATVFTSYAMSEALLELGEKAEASKESIESLKKAASWFTGMDEDRAVNQQTGAALALFNLFLLTGEERYKKACEEKINYAKSRQHPEGWFPEYKGADIGYLSLAVDYLSKYYKKSADASVLPAIGKAVEFLSYFVHPDGSFGGEYGSRNTAYMIPDGFEILSKEMPVAAALAAKVRDSLEKGSSVWLKAIDDRYLTYITYTYLQAYLDSSIAVNSAELPADRRLTREFPGAGLWVYGDKDLYLIANYKKGGTLRACFKAAGRSINDCGVMVETSEGQRSISSWLADRDAEMKDASFSVGGSLMQSPSNYLSPAKTIFLRTFQLTAGKSPFVAGKVKGMLRDKLITKTRSGGVHFTREVAVADGKLYITDTVNPLAGIKRLIVGGTASHIYTPSSRYFQDTDLYSVPLLLGPADLQPYAAKNRITIHRTYDSQGDLIETKLE